MIENFPIRWYLSFDPHGSLQIKEVKLTKHAPINRVLDKTGFFAVDQERVNGHSYILVFEPEEIDRLKSKMLISRVRDDGRGLQSMREEDKETVLHIAHLWMGLSINLS